MYWEVYNEHVLARLPPFGHGDQGSSGTAFPQVDLPQNLYASSRWLRGLWNNDRCRASWSTGTVTPEPGRPPRQMRRHCHFVAPQHCRSTNAPQAVLVAPHRYCRTRRARGHAAPLVPKPFPCDTVPLTSGNARSRRSARAETHPSIKVPARASRQVLRHRLHCRCHGAEPLSFYRRSTVKRQEWRRQQVGMDVMPTRPLAAQCVSGATPA